MDDMAEAGKSVLASIGNPSIANVLGGSNLAILMLLGVLLRDAANEQTAKAEDTQIAVARVEVTVDTISDRFETVQNELADLKGQVAKLQESGASASDVRALEDRIDRLEKCIRDKRRCSL